MNAVQALKRVHEPLQWIGTIPMVRIRMNAVQALKPEWELVGWLPCFVVTVVRIRMNAVQALKLGGIRTARLRGCSIRVRIRMNAVQALKLCVLFGLCPVFRLELESA